MPRVWKSRRLYRVILVGAIGFSCLIDTTMYGLFALAGTIQGWVVGVYGAVGLGHWYCFRSFTGSRMWSAGKILSSWPGRCATPYSRKYWAPRWRRSWLLFS